MAIQQYYQQYIMNVTDMNLHIWSKTFQWHMKIIISLCFFKTLRKMQESLTLWINILRRCTEEVRKGL